MIKISLEMTPQTSCSLDALYDNALPAVIKALSESGYAIDEEPTSEAVDDFGSLRQYRLKPGAGTLWAATNKTDGGSVQFTLDGAKFGRAGGIDCDPVVWMRLVVLGVQLKETYAVLAGVSDPDPR